MADASRPVCQKLEVFQMEIAVKYIISNYIIYDIVDGDSGVGFGVGEESGGAGKQTRQITADWTA